MAKVVITIEDFENGQGVKCTAEPNFETMMMMVNSGRELTPAEGYAVCALNAVRRESKKQGPTRIWVPRLGR